MFSATADNAVSLETDLLAPASELSIHVSIL
jgi:hypothetical protein